MWRWTGLLLCLALAPAAVADLISTRHFASLAEVQAYVIGGFEFYGRGDTQQLHMIRTNPPAHATTPFDLWNNGVPHGFKVVHNAGGVTGISIDDLYAISLPVSISPDTDGLLVTAQAAGTGRSVRVSNLKITLPGFVIYDVNDQALAPPDDYLLIETDLPLAAGFILSGTVTFSWSGPLPPPAEQWFEVTPVVIPEAATCILSALGGLAALVTRRRR